MPNAISNTSPLLYLYRINAIDWLPHLFDELWVPTAVVNELREGQLPAMTYRGTNNNKGGILLSRPCIV